MTRIENTDAERTVRDQVRELWLLVVPKSTSGTFADCGGDSLSGLRLIGAVYKALGIRMTWSDLNAAQDVDEFAGRVAAKSG